MRSVTRMPSAEKIILGEREAIKECDRRLATIIRTVRQNNVKLMHRIEECDKLRERQVKVTKCRPSFKELPDKTDKVLPKMNEHLAVVRRPFSQVRMFKESEGNRAEKTVKENTWRENLCPQGHQKQRTMSGDIYCQQNEQERADVRLVRVKASRLVPLSMEQVRDRRKIL